RPETYLPTATNSHFGIKLEANDAYTSDVPSMASIANSELGMIVKKMNGTTNQEHLRNHSPSRWLSQPAYSTGSLDRRILRARQALHQNGGSQESPLKNNGISSTSNGKVLTTTFPAGAMTDGGVIETTRPLESSDILKYRSSSQNHHHENMKSISASAIHPNRLYSANINGTHWNQNLSHTKDPRMEALLEHYKTANNNTSPISKPAVASSNTSNPKAATMV
uniref:Uncharacterized protein n=1 Tax=Acrobeloides nanus TaxID=290746 RepID=A0A914DWM5_9BILA